MVRISSLGRSVGGKPLFLAAATVSTHKSVKGKLGMERIQVSFVAPRSPKVN
jgi:hypothetical protein